MNIKERLLAIFMLICFGISVAVMIIGSVRGNESLVVSGFGVMIGVFLYSLYTKKRMQSNFEEEQARREEPEQEPDPQEENSTHS